MCSLFQNIDMVVFTEVGKQIYLFTDSDAIFEMSIWQCIMVYSGYMKSKQTSRYRTRSRGKSLLKNVYESWEL